MANFGHDRERALVKRLREEGRFAMRAPGSLGAFDVLELAPGSRPRFYECKATAAGPYAGFGPKDREELVEIAALAGADAWLCWWPKRAKPTFIHESEWP